MDSVNMHEAKTHLSKLIERVLNGEEVVISKSGKPVARLVPYQVRSAARKSGAMKGKIKLEPDFDAPLPDDLLDLFGGRGD